MKKKRVISRTKTNRSQKYSGDVAYATGVPLASDMGDLIDAYKLHPWVYKAIQHIASDYASIPLEVLKQQADGDTIPELLNPFTTRLFKYPNPFMSFYDIQEFTAISLECAGNAYWGLERSTGGEIVEIWPLPPDKVKIVSSKSNMIEKYVLDVAGVPISYAVDDIIHQKYISPFSMLYGQGSLTASRNTIITDLFAEKYNQIFFQNSARPDAIIEMDRTVDAGSRKRMVQAWKEMYGGVKNARKLAILEKGSKYVPLNQNKVDMEFTESRKQARETIIGNIGVPPSVLGILEFANFANMKEQSQVYWKYTMLPKIKRRDATLTMRVNQLLFRNDLIVKSDLSGVEALRDDELTRSKVIRAYWDMGIPLNTLIDTFELPFEHVEGGDTPKPAGTPDGNTATTDTPPPASVSGKDIHAKI